MKAIVRKNNGIELSETPKPSITDQDDIIIRVKMAGLCRTDMYVAQGTIHVSDGLILGHEFSGIVESVGSHVTHLKVGTRVGIMPVYENRQKNLTILGKDKDGAFAEHIAVPASCVFPIPDSLSYHEAAYLEPVAASLAATKVHLGKNAKGLIYGDNRIAELTRRIMQIHGFTSIDAGIPKAQDSQLHNAYEFIVETALNDASLEHIIDLLKPGGTLVLKSRPYRSVMLPATKIVQKELILAGAYYGSFKDAINLIASGKLKTDDLFGQTLSFEEAVQILSGAKKASEDKKIFFRP